jgi:GntR family transcriptional regulator
MSLRGLDVRSTIDKSSGIPYYEQLCEILEQAMRGGPLAIDDRLPNQAQLCEEHGVSRTVVRQALNQLANDGLIVRHKGKGCFVSRPKADQTLVFERQQPPAHISQVLELGEGDSVVRLDRLRSVDGEPWMVTSTFLPYDLSAPLLDCDVRHHSLDAILERNLGLRLERGRRTIESALAGPAHAALLAIEPGAPVLLLKGIDYLASGRPLVGFLAWHRGDRSRFDVELQRHRAGREGSGTEHRSSARRSARVPDLI